MSKEIDQELGLMPGNHFHDQLARKTVKVGMDEFELHQHPKGILVVGAVSSYMVPNALIKFFTKCSRRRRRLEGG